MHGFTLLELLIVVLVLGILAALAFPVMAKSVTDARLRGAVSEVATALRYARATALNTGRTTRVVFDAVAETVEVSQIVHMRLDDLLDTGQSELAESHVDRADVWNFEVMDDPVHPGNPYRIDYGSEEVFGGVDIVSAVFGAGATVEFSALGAASEDGIVTIDFGGRQGGINVDSVTGAISVSN